MNQYMMMLSGKKIFEKMKLSGSMYSMIFCIWYVWLVLVLGDRFLEMICSCVKNCDVIMRMMSVIRMMMVVVFWVFIVLLSVLCSEVILKSLVLQNFFVSFGLRRLILLMLFCVCLLMLFSMLYSEKKMGICMSRGRQFDIGVVLCFLYSVMVLWFIVL